MSNSPNLCAQNFANIHQSGRSTPFHGYINYHPSTHSNIYFRYSYRSNRISSGTVFTKWKFSLNTCYSILSEVLYALLLKLIFLVSLIQLYALWLSRLKSTNRTYRTENRTDKPQTRDLNCDRIMVTKSTLYIKIFLYILILLVYP